MDGIITAAMLSVEANLQASTESQTAGEAQGFASTAAIAFNVLTAAKEMKAIDDGLGGGGGDGDEAEIEAATDEAVADTAKEITYRD